MIQVYQHQIVKMHGIIYAHIQPLRLIQQKIWKQKSARIGVK